MTVLDRFVVYKFLRWRWLSFPLMMRCKAGLRPSRPTNCVRITKQRTESLKKRAHGKILESRTLFGIYPPIIAVRSRSGVDVIIRPLRLWCFLWRFGPLLCDARAICGTRWRGVTGHTSLYDRKCIHVQYTDIMRL